MRVLIVEPSSVMSDFLTNIINADDSLKVVGYAQNGKQLLERVSNLQPNLVLIDVDDLAFGGLQLVLLVMQENPVPVVTMSSNKGNDECALSIKAVNAGALCLVVKPRSQHADKASADEFVAVLKAMSAVRVIKKRKKKNKLINCTSTPLTPNYCVVGIAASTGGPSALLALLASLPSDFPVPILIAQHMLNGFTEGFVTWLNQRCQLIVKLAQDKEIVKPGVVYIARENYHLGVDAGFRVRLADLPPIDGHKPSASYLFESVAANFGEQALAIILTGMGNDGVKGLKLMHEAGATIIAQDERSSAIYGMPKRAVESGVVTSVLELKKIAVYLQELGKGTSR